MRRSAFLALFELLHAVHGLVDCRDGFTGRTQDSLEDEFVTVNETRMCAAPACIRVLVHGAFDDDGRFQQGISSRCAYTGGDRQSCLDADKNNCTQLEFYDGMRGSFSFCCCREDDCNAPRDEDLHAIFTAKDRKKSTSRSVTQLLTFPFALVMLLR